LESINRHGNHRRAIYGLRTWTKCVAADGVSAVSLSRNEGRKGVPVIKDLGHGALAEQTPVPHAPSVFGGNNITLATTQCGREEPVTASLGQ